MSSLPRPKLFRNEQNSQLSYEVPHRITCAVRHPVPSPNGSTVVIYGHENGVRIIWRGGRRLKASEPKQNGNADAVMIIDSDDEQEETTEFETDDSDDPIPPIIHQVDVNFGPVLHLAVISSTDLIFAAACADFTIRVVYLPLAPTKATADVAVLTGFSAPPAGVAITLKDKNILVASYSREVTGLLLIHRIPVSKRGDKSILSKDNGVPVITRYLPSPAQSIAFNPSSYLLVADKSACRIYSPDQDAWLITLYPGFGKSEYPNHGRKFIVDAKWVQGKAVMALLADGEWGVWDVDGCGPGASRGLLGGQTIKGGATTQFTISGWIEGSLVKSRSASSSKFAPMTPSTRKTAEPALFSGRYSSASAGQISVCSLPKATTAGSVDECVALWLEDSYAVIPSIRAFWDNQVRGNGSNIFGGGASARITKIHAVTLGGERCTSIDQCPVSSNSKATIPTELLIAGEHRLLILSGLSHEKILRRTSNHDMRLVPSQAMDVMA